MNGYNLNPKTCLVPAATLKQGDIVLESEEHPARVVRTRRPRQGQQLQISCRYIWQSKKEPSWLLGSFQSGALLLKAVD